METRENYESAVEIGYVYHLFFGCSTKYWQNVDMNPIIKHRNVWRKWYGVCNHIRIDIRNNTGCSDRIILSYIPTHGRVECDEMKSNEESSKVLLTIRQPVRSIREKILLIWWKLWSDSCGGAENEYRNYNIHPKIRSKTWPFSMFCSISKLYRGEFRIGILCIFASWLTWLLYKATFSFQTHLIIMFLL